MTLAGKKNLEPLTLLRAKKALKGPKIEQTRKKKPVNKMSKNVSHTISVSQPVIFYQLLLPPETGYFHLKVYC